MPDALQEFSVQTSNYSAQYGQNAGGVVNVITKSVPTNSMEMRLSFCVTRSSMQDHGSCQEGSTQAQSIWRDLWRSLFLPRFGEAALPFTTVAIEPSSLRLSTTIQRNILQGNTATFLHSTKATLRCCVIELLKHIPRVMRIIVPASPD